MKLFIPEKNHLNVSCATENLHLLATWTATWKCITPLKKTRNWRVIRDILVDIILYFFIFIKLWKSHAWLSSNSFNLHQKPLSSVEMVALHTYLLLMSLEIHWYVYLLPRFCATFQLIYYSSVWKRVQKQSILKSTQEEYSWKKSDQRKRREGPMYYMQCRIYEKRKYVETC